MTDDTTDQPSDSEPNAARTGTEAETDTGAVADADDADAVDPHASEFDSAAEAMDEEGARAEPSVESDSKTRDVVVPMRVYKAVTVFTTLFAVVTVVGGFIVLDTATNRARASLSEVDPVLALVGVGLIVVGAAAYAFSTRFRAEGMGKSKDDTDEDSDNG
jgi:hypothetical protein